MKFSRWLRCAFGRHDESPTPSHYLYAHGAHLAEHRCIWCGDVTRYVDEYTGANYCDLEQWIEERCP